MGLLVSKAEAVAPSLTGLDWDGTTLGTGPNYTNGSRRMLYWPASSYTLPDPYPFTVLYKKLSRSQTPANDRFSADWFRGNSADFNFGSNYGSGYYGWTEYPWPDRSDESSPEVSAGQGSGSTTDRVTRDNSSDPGNDKAADTPYTTFGGWHARALTARFVTGSPGHYEHKGYVDTVAGVDSSRTVTSTRDSAWNSPPLDSIFMGQTGQNVTIPGTGQSWGGEARWEESNGIFRGIQKYARFLTTGQIQARNACETDAEVLALNTADGFASTDCWYLNMNPTPSDVTDKSGNGHHGLWQGAARPTLWTE
jgi:hypothetical protein